MVMRVEKKKWVFYRHTSNFEIVNAIAVQLKNFSKANISKEEKYRFLQQLKSLEYYKERNPELPLDAINHKINTLAYFMFGYKDGNNFLFSPLGNLFLKYVGDKEKKAKIFLAMLWNIQFPHPLSEANDGFNLYPFRLLFKLLNDSRLEYKLFAFEVSAIVVFTKDLKSKEYDKLVEEMLEIRKFSDSKLEKLFKDEENAHAFVNSIYEWDYYMSKFLQTAGILIHHNKEQIVCKLLHGASTTRKLTRNYVTLNDNIKDFCKILLKNYPYDEIPVQLNDSEKLTIDIKKEIYSFYPRELLHEIGEVQNELQLDIIELPKLIEQYSNNNENEEAYLFEEVLTKAFNLFINVIAKRIGGAGQTDIECKYIDDTNGKIFAIDCKSTKNKLNEINGGRLRLHRRKIGATYTIVVTSRYLPSVLTDIEDQPIVIITAATLAEFLYNSIMYNHRNIDYTDIQEIIINNFGKDISPIISKLTIEKFGFGKNE